MDRRGIILPEIKFPIIVFSNDVVSVATSLKQFTKWSRPVVKDTDYYKKIILVDGLGTKYIIQSVEELSYTNMFWGLDIFGDQTVYVKLTLSFVEALDLNAFKTLAINAAKMNMDNYLSAGIELRAVIEDIKTASNYTDIIVQLKM